ncbi:AMP-binding protein [Amycolatopsis saalfeldensis]|uniref:Amino acid adenylation domain-containing protein n=1 Tax=Amycolatopsis saalfeldensis TaxID=394193 RepID=A0A1H8YKI7_9PSEU|nr:AMP-binding protein [Amycolatopsis saalfeldensis]SEP52667.1 amino acid adenylation domain-containing protein [Amycolatopsis saalfeldensis]
MPVSASAVHEDLARLFDAVDRWAERIPAETAFSAPDGTLDFRGLARHTASIASALAEAGTRAGTVVGVATGRSRFAAAGLLAVWRLGATAVLLDDRHPAERLAFVLDDAGVEVLLAHETAPFTGNRPRVDPETASETETVLEPVSPGEVAYIVYTSGTTGRPKGVEITYGGLGVFLTTLAEIGLTPGGLGVNALSPAFDGWLWCTLLHLLHGQGTAIIDLTDERTDDVDLAQRIAAIGPRTVVLTPSLMAACTGALSTAEVVVVAGERCPRGLAELLAANHRVLNVYGPTEATMAATWADTARGDDVSTIGRAPAGYSAVVLDEDRSPVAEGTPGELYLGGDALARGYRNQPELTAERFVSVPGIADRLYRTGDLVSARPDGQLDYLGRVDDQVKVRGFRIEPAELEKVVEQLPAITTAAAFVLESGAALGIAAVVAAGHDLTAGAAMVRAHCRAKLPDHLVPAVVDFVPALPATANGKVDREALSRASAEAHAPARRAPSTPREAEVCATWSELLDRPVTDVDADFFELGGHSLLAARAVAALRRSTGVRFSITLLLANPTPAQLARELDRRTEPTAESVRPASWLVAWHPKPAQRPTLLCLAHGGAGCGRYRSWQDRLGDGVSVVGVQLPGRENRWREEHPSTMAEAAEAVAAEVAELIEPTAPLVVFGESFGGLLGYEVTRRLGERGRPPAALVIAASDPPHTWAGNSGRYGSDDVIRKLLDNSSAEVKELDQDAREYTLGIMRKDGALASTFVLPAETRLDSAVHAWGGDTDQLVSSASLDEWSSYTTKEFDRRQFDGGHMFGTELAGTTLPLLAKLLTGGGAAC